MMKIGFLHKLNNLIFNRRSVLVDEKFYFHAYPDVASSGMSAIEHFHSHGWREGRNPSSEFHTLYYAAKHMPGGELSSNPLYHLSLAGTRCQKGITAPSSPEEWAVIQKRKVLFAFDSQFYRLKYRDYLGECDPIDHYFSEGWRIGLNPNKNFDTEFYVKAHNFIVSSDVNPLYHFVIFNEASMGKEVELAPDVHDVRMETDATVKEARSIRVKQLSCIAPYFDSVFYCNENPDVVSAKAHPLTHFFDYGWREWRNPNEWFWTKYYATKYARFIPANTNPFYHYLSYGMRHDFRPNPLGREKWPRPLAPNDEQWAIVQAANGIAEQVDVSIIMPVYKGYDDTLAAIYSVLVNEQKSSFELIVVYDCGPEPELKVKLLELAEKGLFTYLENESNLGFVRTVNKALQMRPKNDVILLNADVLVFGNWLDRLLDHAKFDPKAATITPFSNNATICSYPQPYKDNSLALECSCEDLDRYASVCNAGKNIHLPTGVGFCFYIRRSVIDEVGDLDIEFGRGYGEENDFCMRALKAGYHNLFAQDIFVYHSGQVSFASFREEEYEPGQALLSFKHPDYLRRVEAFMYADPSEKGRIRLDLFRLAQHFQPRSAVLISINTSGGIITHVQNFAKRLEAAGLKVIVIYLEGDSAKVEPFVEERAIYTPSLSSINLLSNSQLIVDFLNWLKPEILHLHSLAILRWQATKVLMDALGKVSSPFYVTLHDFDSLCHRHHLVDQEGRFCNPIDLTKCQECVESDKTAIDAVSPSERWAIFDRFLNRARKVFVPSADTMIRISKYFPNANFLVRPHEEDLTGIKFLTQAGEVAAPLRIVAIGAIGQHKGCDVIHSLAFDAKLRNLPINYTIVGYSAISARMKAVGVVETGRYADIEQCVDEIAQLQPHFAFFPSIWPETYCYTLSIAFALGIPPIVFDLGAQSERVRSAGFGVVYDPAYIMEPQALNNAILRLSVKDEWAKRNAGKFPFYENFPRSYYEGNSL